MIAEPTPSPSPTLNAEDQAFPILEVALVAGGVILFFIVLIVIWRCILRRRAARELQQPPFFSDFDEEHEALLAQGVDEGTDDLNDSLISVLEEEDRDAIAPDPNVDELTSRLETRLGRNHSDGNANAHSSLGSRNSTGDEHASHHHGVEHFTERGTRASSFRDEVAIIFGGSSGGGGGGDVGGEGDT